MKISPVGAALFRADGWKDGQTDMTKVIVACRNSAKAPENNVTQWIEYFWQNTYVFLPDRRREG